MTGMVFGSAGTPLSPWHAAQSCAFVSISSAACAGGMATARPIPIPKIAEKKRVTMTIFLPSAPAGSKCGRIPYLSRSSSHQESPMRAKLMLTLAATAAAMVFPAVGYDIDSPAKATVANGKAATADIKLKTTKNLAGQLTNAEWMMSIPGTEEQKAGLLNCVGCHTLERVLRSTHDSDEWTHVISRMMGYGAVSQPIKPQPMLDRNRAGTPEQYRKLADYLATINLSAVDHWPYELKTLPRPKGRDTRAIVTQYDVVRPTSEPHDVLVDKEGKVWYTDFGEMFIGKFDPKSLKLVEYQIKKFKEKAPTGLLSIEFDREGKIWFDTMYQGALGCLDPQTGKIAYYPLPPEYNDDTVQLNFTGLRYDIDGKVWTKSVGTQHIFRLDLATNKWERFHPTDYLPEGAPKNAGIYQVISDSQNNLWMAEFTQGHLC